MTHYIIVKWNDNANKRDLSVKVRRLYADAVKIAGVNDVAVRDNIIARDNRYDIMIALDIDENALTVWDNSVLHNKWKSEYGGLIAKKCIIDCE